MKQVKTFTIFCALVFFGAYAAPAQASTIGDLQMQLISLLNQLVALLRHEPVPPVVPRVASSTAPYVITDIVSVTTRSVDPNPLLADDEYVLYTVTLNDGTVRTIRTAGFSTLEMKQQEFYKSGYSGDITKLMALATPQTISEAKPTIVSLTSQLANRADISFIIVLPANGIPSVMGPIMLGSINWGDGNQESIYGLATESGHSMTKTHTYSTKGIYQVVITATNGTYVSRAVTVK